MLSETEREEAKEKLEACLNHMERLNDWEKHFVENNSELLENHGILTTKQLEVLDQIYEKIK